MGPTGIIGPSGVNPIAQENIEVKQLLIHKTNANAELQNSVNQTGDALGQLENEYAALQQEAQALKEGMLHEQFNANKAMAEVETLKIDLEAKDQELRELRSSWTEREKRIEQLETQRIFYEEELSSIGHQYQALLDKLSFVITDYSVRTAPIQVRVGGGYELLSTYLNRIFEDQNKLKDQYDRTVPHSPAVTKKYSPEVRPL